MTKNVANYNTSVFPGSLFVEELVLSIPFIPKTTLIMAVLSIAGGCAIGLQFSLHGLMLGSSVAVTTVLVCAVVIEGFVVPGD